MRGDPKVAFAIRAKTVDAGAECADGRDSAAGPAQDVGIVTGRRAITADTDLRLCRLFGLPPGWWLKLQIDYDLRRAKARLVNELEKITPLEKPR